jgi:hypothetical protein
MTFPSFHDSTHLYFITASIVDWKHLFITPEYTNIPLNSLGAPAAVLGGGVTTNRIFPCKVFRRGRRKEQKCTAMEQEKT